MKLLNKLVKYLSEYNKVTDKLKDMNKIICKFVCLGYTSTYCYKFFELLNSGSSNLENPVKIIHEINRYRKFSIIVSFNIRKIIYDKNKKNIVIFINQEYFTKYH